MFLDFLELARNHRARMRRQRGLESFLVLPEQNFKRGLAFSRQDRRVLRNSCELRLSGIHSTQPAQFYLQFEFKLAELLPGGKRELLERRIGRRRGNCEK